MRCPTLLVAALLLPAAALAHEGPRAEMAALDTALEARPGDVELLLRRAALLRRDGQLAASLTDLAVVAHLAPARRELYAERGLTRAAAGDAAGAEADLTRFLAGGPQALVLAARARLREAAGRLDEARADYDAAVALRPEPETYLARGRLDEARGQLDRAVAGYAEGLRACGGAVSIRLALIRAEGARGRHDRVVALADEALASAPFKAEWLLLRADGHAGAGRFAAALRDRAAALREVDEGLRRRPTDLMRLVRARALLALGRSPEAARELQAILTRSPDLAEARALLQRARRSP